jgi:hypothetical protein
MLLFGFGFGLGVVESWFGLIAVVVCECLDVMMD